MPPWVAGNTHLKNEGTLTNMGLTTRAHNKHNMEGSKPITHALQNQAWSTCMCGDG